MPESLYKQQELAIQKAVEVYELDKSQKVTELARVYEVPYSRLWNRIKGRSSRSARPASNRLFKDDQENTLKTWIKFLDDTGVPPTIKLLRYHGCLVMQHQTPIGETPHLVGENWPYRFMRRLPEQYRTSVQTATEFNKSNPQDPGVVRSWFDRLQAQLDTYRIKPENLYTADEMGFRVGEGDTEAEITTYRVSKQVDGTVLHESMTIVECLNVAGNVIPPFIILADNAHLDDWKHNIQPDWKLTVSLNGFASDELAMEWLHHFDMSTCERARNQHRLLLVNNFGVHITEQFLQYCQTKNIILHSFPPHITRLFRLLDGKLFQDYRNFHGEAVSRQTEQGDHYFDKGDFLYSINELRQQTFVRRKIKTELEERGIWPLNAEIVVEKLQSKPVSTDEPMDETLVGDEPNLPCASNTKRRLPPPKEKSDFGDYVKRLKRDLDILSDMYEEANPDLRRRLQKAFEASIYKADLSDLHKNRVEQLTEATNAEGQASDTTIQN